MHLQESLHTAHPVLLGASTSSRLPGGAGGHMSLITLPDHLLHRILLHVRRTTAFSLTHPSLHAAVTTATRLSLAHAPPHSTHLHHLTLSSAALHALPSFPAFPALPALRSLTLPPLTARLLPAAKALLSATRPPSLTLHPSPLTASLAPYLSPSHLTALPHHPAFLSHALSLLHLLPLKSFHLHLPPRLLPHDELVAVARRAASRNVRYRLTIPAYDYPFHSPHTAAPIVAITIGCVMLRHEALWRDLTGWKHLERVSVGGAEEGALERLVDTLRSRIRRVCVGEREEVLNVMKRGKGVRNGVWMGVERCVRAVGVGVEVVDDAGGRGRDFVTLLLWKF